MFFPLIPHILIIVFSFLMLSPLAVSSQQPPATGRRVATQIKKPSQTELSRFLQILSAKRDGNLELNSPDPCSRTKSIGYGQAHRGQLDSFDCRLEDGTYVEIYLLEAGKDQEIQIDMWSTDIDSYLAILDESGEFIMEDDDSGGGYNARINTPLPHPGFYLILALSYLPEIGDYEIALEKTPRCAFAVTPDSAVLAPGGDTSSFDVATEIGCYWKARSPQRPYILLWDWGTAEDVGYYGPRTITYDIKYNESGVEFQGSVIAGDAIHSVRQPALVCTYSVDKKSLTFPGAASTQQIQLTTPVGCAWRGFNSISYFALDPWSGRGPANLTVRTYTNNGTTRTGTITIEDQVIEITQHGLACTYSLSATTFQVAADPEPGVIGITTQPDCVWGIESDGMIQYNAQAGPGPREITYYFNRNYGAEPRSHTVRFYGGGVVTIPLTFNQAGAGSRPVTVSGRVVTTDGRAIRGVTVDLVDAESGTVKATVTSSTLGYFSYSDVPSGYGYFLRPRSKRFRFSQIYYEVLDDLSGIELKGLE